MCTPKAKRIKLEGPVFTTPIRFAEDDTQETTPSTPAILSSPSTPVCPGNEDSDAECTGSEFKALRQTLHERNAQRENLLFKIKELSETRRRYKARLEKHHQPSVLQKKHDTLLSDRDHLISSLKDLLGEYEKTIHQLQHGKESSGLGEQRTRDDLNSPSSSVDAFPTSSCAVCSMVSCGRSKVLSLVEDLQRVQEEKAHLVSHLEDTQGQLETLQAEHEKQRAVLQKRKVESEAAFPLSDDKEYCDSNGDQGTSWTDTETQLDRLKMENRRLTGEVASLRRFYSRNTSLGYSCQAEQLRTLEDDNEELRSRLSAADTVLQQKEAERAEQEEELKAELSRLEGKKDRMKQQMSELHSNLSSLRDQQAQWQEQETALRSQISTAHSQQQETVEQLRSVQTKCATLLSRDPDVVTKVVKVEVESKDLQRQVTEALQQVGDWQRRCSDREAGISNLQRQVQLLTDKGRQLEEMSDRVKGVMHDCGRLKQSYEGLLQQVNLFPQLVATTVQDVRDKIVQAVHEVSAQNKDLARKYQHEMMLRKKYHNTIVELKGNIRVFCRVRPPIKEDGTGSHGSVVNFDPVDDQLIYVSNKGRMQTFELDKVFPTTSTQAQVFDEVKSLVISCVDGYNVCIFAYGQTGSGKTFTMEGPTADPGINQRALQQLFAETSDRARDWTFTITVSVLEIYNETIKDLLSSDSGKLDVRMKAEGGGFHVPGLISKTMTSIDDVNKVFDEGKSNRATACTNMNEHSSRSHCLLCVTVTGVNHTTHTRTLGRLNLVDLAGSERVSKSGADGTRLKEAQNINRSLSSLGDVIHALRVKQSHIPYRNSKLTFLLQDSLGGDSKTLMLVHVAPVEKNVLETICSLNFGQRVRTVELGEASRKLEGASPSCNTVNSPLLERAAMMSPKSSPTTRVTRLALRK